MQRSIDDNKRVYGKYIPPETSKTAIMQKIKYKKQKPIATRHMYILMIACKHSFCIICCHWLHFSHRINGYVVEVSFDINNIFKNLTIHNNKFLFVMHTSNKVHRWDRMKKLHIFVLNKRSDDDRHSFYYLKKKCINRPSKSIRILW